MTIPAAQEDTLQLAEAIATQIAHRCEGVVYNPQAESMVWPKVKFAFPSSSSRSERIRVVRLLYEALSTPTHPIRGIR
jgi:hypothetical protein